jgi:selenocysteine lyase/cysteine desulfurase
VTSTASTASVDITSARAEFAGGRGYLAACTVGLPSRSTLSALSADLRASAAGHPDPVGYTAAAERARGDFARLVGVPSRAVAIGSQVSVLAGLVAGGLPDGARVLVADGDFSSVLLPFVHAGRGIHVESVPLARLADSIDDRTALVAFSLVQSATGAVADGDAIAEAARRHGARTLCDATQAVGWMPVTASTFDAVVCHAYKWLCAPRGAAFLAVSEDFARDIRPLYAGWYAGADPWTSCYGTQVVLAEDASRFDVSPAWQAFVGAAPAIALFASIDAGDLLAYTTGLAAAFRAARGLDEPARASAIVAWEDPDGSDLARLTAAGVRASGRAGRARVGFHVFNDEEDVALAVAALAR